MRCSFRTHPFSRMRFPGRCPGLVCVAHSGPLTDEVGSVLNRAVYFPLAGYAGPGFQNWPGSADVLVGEYETGDSHPKKKAFGAATGVSDPRLQKIRIRNNGAGQFTSRRGPMARCDFDPVSSPQPRHRVPTDPRSSVGAYPQPRFRLHALRGHPVEGKGLGENSSHRPRGYSRLIDQWLLWPVFLSF